MNNRMNLRLGLLLALLGILIAGCADINDPADTAEWNEQVVPDASVRVGEEPGTVAIEMGLINTSNEPVPTIDEFDGSWVLLQSNGDVRARGEVLTAGPLEPLESEYPLIWSGQLDSDTYTLMWGEYSLGTVTLEFQVMRDGESVGVGTSDKQISDSFLIEITE